ncbi:MAG TPA: two-component regulator propeller domain-containing protein [Pyrinomonadaceae bacterium]
MLKGQITIKLLGLALLLLASATVYALDPHKALNEFGVQVWLTENGLPQNSVQVITQTNDGYLWIGTQEGLARFNSTGFVVFDKDNTPQFKSNDVRALLEDRNGALWIGTSYGLLRFQSDVFTAFNAAEGLPDNSVTALVQTVDGIIWIGTANGLARYANNSLAAFPGPNEDIQALLTDASGDLWIGRANGLTKVQRNSNVQSEPLKEISGHSVNAIVQDKAGRLLFGTDDGLFINDQNGTRLITASAGLPHEHINSLSPDREGCVWIGTSNGLARLRFETSPVITVAPGLSSNLILTSFEDREGSLWIGTEAGGLNQLRDKKFTTLTTRQGLASDLIKAVYQDRSGAVWIGTSGAGISVFKDGKVTNYTTKEGLVSNVVLSLYSDNSGAMWIGTPDGLNRFSNGKFEAFTVAEGLSSDQIRSIYVDREGTVWIGTRNGLNRIKNGEFTIFTTKDGLANDFIGAIFEDSNRTLWVGTRAGLSEFKGGKFTNFTIKEGLSSDVITSLHEDYAHNIWIGTNGGGLNRMQNGRFTSYTTRNGLLDNVIYRILEDAQQNLWLSSPKGISKISVFELNDFADGKVHTLTSTAYGTSDGMLTRECSGGGYPAGWRDRDGKLWFSTIKGVAIIDPASTQFNKEPPPVSIEQILVDDRQLTDSGAVQLSPVTTRLEFYYTALSYVAPDKVRFRYRLEGFDPDWIDAGAKRSASYTNLRPGKYTFRVLAANNDGVWNEQGAAFQFYLRPHFYQTYWFYALLVLLLALLIWSIYQLRVRSLKSQFDAVLVERTRIAREIHDNLAQELLGISVQLEVVARTMPPGAEVAKNHLDRVRMLIRHGIAEARRYVWDLRSQALDNSDLPTALKETAQRLTADSNVEAQVQVGGMFRQLPREVEDNLLRIAQEAINNAVTHAHPEHVIVNLIFAINKVQLSVRDDGRGFEPTSSAKNGHFGLVGMRERAERIGGKLNIVSSLDTGTEVVVDVPITN